LAFVIRSCNLVDLDSVDSLAGCWILTHFLVLDQLISSFVCLLIFEFWRTIAFLVQFFKFIFSIWSFIFTYLICIWLFLALFWRVFHRFFLTILWWVFLRFILTLNWWVFQGFLLTVFWRVYFRFIFTEFWRVFYWSFLTVYQWILNRLFLAFLWRVFSPSRILFFILAGQSYLINVVIPIYHCSHFLDCIINCHCFALQFAYYQLAVLVPNLLSFFMGFLLFYLAFMKYFLAKKLNQFFLLMTKIDFLFILK
jgi:hypothetical protein